MLKIIWKDKVTNENVLTKMKQKSLHFINNVLRKKMANANHNLIGSGGPYALLLLKRKFERKKQEKRVVHNFSI